MAMAPASTGGENCRTVRPDIEGRMEIRHRQSPSSRGSDAQSIRIAGGNLAIPARNAGLEVDPTMLWDANLPGFDGGKTAAAMDVITGQSLGGMASAETRPMRRRRIAAVRDR